MAQKQPNDYTPVDPYFFEVLDKAIASRYRGKVHFFENGQVEDAHGKVISRQRTMDGEFAVLDDHTSIRLDRIITLFGKPDPAYEEYESYANACLACEDIGQF